MHTVAPYAELAGRILLAAIFVLSGIDKFSAYADTQAYMAGAGLPGSLLPLVIAFEIGAGLAVAAGWRTRVAALLLAGFTLVTAVVFHGEVGDPMQRILFLKNVAIAGGFLLLVAQGPGPLALDRRGAGARP